MIFGYNFINRQKRAHEFVFLDKKTNISKKNDKKIFKKKRHIGCIFLYSVVSDEARGPMKYEITIMHFEDCGTTCPPFESIYHHVAPLENTWSPLYIKWNIDDRTDIFEGTKLKSDFKV